MKWPSKAKQRERLGLKTYSPSRLDHEYCVHNQQSCLKMCVYCKHFPEMEQLNLVALQDYLILRVLRH